MKKRIILGLLLMSAILVGIVAYTVTEIQRATARLERLVALHEIAIMREDLLVELKRTQSDLYLKNTRYARSIDTIIGHVRTMGGVVNGCFGCHHAESVLRRLDDLRSQSREYEDALSRVLTIRANPERLQAEEDRAYWIGDHLISDVEDITRMTNAKLGERTRSAYRDIDRTKTLLFVVLAVTPFFATGLAVILIRGFTKPIDRLVSATRRLKGGDLGHRIEGLRDEYGEVASSFNEMASSLEESWRKMQWAEQIVVLGELAGGLAHEINNPLAGIKASMEVLSGDPSVGGEPREIILEVARQIERIEQLVRRLLSFAKPPRPAFLSVDVNEVVDETLSLVQRHPAFQRRDDGRIVVEKEFAEDLPRILADPLQLQQVLLNLLLNAAEAMPEGGRVIARTAREGAPGVRVTIADTGPGVDESVLAKIFLPFFTTKSKGTGLGLATSKRLVEQHGGTILVTRPPGGGASFSVVLPVSPPGASGDEDAAEVAGTERLP